MISTTRKHTKAVLATGCAVCTCLKRIQLTFLLLVCSTWITQAQSIFSNNILGTNPAQYNPFVNGQLVDPQLTVSGIGRGQGISSNIGNNIYNAANFNSSSRDTSDYFTFTLIPANGYQMNLSSFSYTGQRNATGPLNFALRSSINNFSSDIGTGNSVASNISLSAVAFQNITSPIEFRLYGWNASSASGTFGVTSFSFNGAVLVAPRLQASALNAFGSVCVGNVSAAQILQLTGTGLTTDSVKLGPLRGYQFSTDGLQYNDSIFLSMPGNQSVNINIRLQPDTIRPYNGNIISLGGGAGAINIAVTGSGIGTRPSITNGIVSTVTTTSASISFSVVGAGCSIITGIGIEYSTVAGFANGTGSNVPLGSFSQTAAGYNMTLTALGPPGQVYYFHTYITNNGGVKYGAENSFTLLSDITVLNVPAAGAGSLGSFGNVCINTITAPLSFTITGSVLNNSPITVGPLNGFSFSSTSTGTYANVLNIVNGGGGYSYVSGNLTNCRVYVKFNPTAIADYSGNIPVVGGGATAISIHTSAFGVNSIPDVITGNAVQITPYAAYLQGSIPNGGCTPLSSYGFEYSTIPGFPPGTGNVMLATNLNNGLFGLNVAGLQPSTVYYYYAFANNAGGIDYGNISTFYTAAVPTQLLITAVTPANPIAFTPFSFVVAAVDNLTDRNPINVTANTYLQLIQTSGVNIFSAAGNPAWMIPAGRSQVVLSGNFYDAAELAVSVKAVATSGMNLSVSPVFYFDVINYTGTGSFIWTQTNGNEWLNGAHWLSGTSPGSTFTNDSNRHVAYFTSQASIASQIGAGAGIDMGQVNGDLSLGAIVFDSTYVGATDDGYFKIGNESSATNGVLQLNGADLINQPVLEGQRTAHVLLSNRIENNENRKVAIVNGVNNGNKQMVVRIVEEGYLIADTGNEIHMNVILFGNLPLHISGGGKVTLQPSGGTGQNDFSGSFYVENGILQIRNDGAFSSTNPNLLILGDLYNHTGILDLNHHDCTIGGLETVTNNSGNIVTSEAGDAVLTIQNTAINNFTGNISNGINGIMSLIKAGSGIQVLSGNNTYTGNTLVTAGTLVLANPNGSTVPSGNDFSISGGTLKFASNQMIHDINLLGGTLMVDTGVVLTITGNYLQSGSFRIINYGKIVMQGMARQNFPGSGAVVEYMNDLTNNNPAGLTMNKSMKVRGVLQLNQGNFNWGTDTLSVCHPITGNTMNLLPSANSWFEIFGNDINTGLPSSVHNLSGLVVSASSGTTISGNLTISQKMVVADTAGTVIVPYDVTLNGNAMLIMQGGKLMLEKNAVLLPEFTGLYQLNGGEIIFNGLGTESDAQMVRPINYHNLTFSSNGGERILSSNGTTGIFGIFSPGSGPVKIDGSTIDFKKPAAQTIPSFTYHFLKITGGNNSIKSLMGPIKVKAGFTMGALTQLNLNNYDVTLTSDSLLTAQVDVVPTANSFVYPGTGRFVVERFIPSGMNHGKSWQFLSVPVSGALLNESWQEGAGPLISTQPGYGITLSSSMSGAIQRGYDFFTPNGGPSVKSYDENTDNWIGVDDGVRSTAQVNISNSKGYMIFVRGDRSVLQYNSPATKTIIRCRGKLYAKGTDAPPAVTLNPGLFTSIGNPYASGVDFLSLQSASTGLDQVFYVWDPLLPGAYGLGGYQTISVANAYHPVPGGTSNYDNANSYTKIASGQAFIVHSSTGGTVQFAENQKSSTQAIPFRNNGRGGLQLNMQLLNGEEKLVDGALLMMSALNTNDISEKDVLKFKHQTADLSLQKQQHDLAIASFPYPLDTDTVYLRMKLNKVGNYHLRFNLDNISRNTTSIFLHDDSLSIDLPLNNSIYDYYFTAAVSDLNITSQRFYLIFKKRNKVELRSDNLSSASARQNSFWVNAETLNRHTIKISSNIDFDQIGAAKIFDSQGKLIAPIGNGPISYKKHKCLKINKNLPAGIYILQINLMKSGRLVQSVSTQVVM